MTFIAKVTAKAGSEGQLAEALTSLIAPTRAETGCRHYFPHASLDNPREFHIYESWNTESDFETHTKTPHFQAMMARFPELLDGPPSRIMLRDLG
ncbi:MAG: antibiotic biosynthesis monooxygenase [Labilithrix sp.]|nr:antibiotic biosynthesis monooxygenase [Labilithrix sp.]